MPDDRPPFNRDRGGDRPTFGGPPRPFVRSNPPPRPAGDLQPPHSVRLRDGDREVEVTGSAPFVRQILDDLPTLLARLRGEGATSRVAATSLPSPRQVDGTVRLSEPIADPAPRLQGRATASPSPRSNGAQHTSVQSSPSEELLGVEILEILRGSARPLAIAAIRAQLRDDVTGQRVRRFLENHDQVLASNDRPATYRLRGRR